MQVLWYSIESDQCKGLRSPATGRLLFFALIQWKSCCGRKIRNTAELYCVLWTAHGNFKQCKNCFGYELWGGGSLAGILNSHRRITPENWSNRQKDSLAIPSPTAGLSFQRRNKENRRFPVQFIALVDSWQGQTFDKLDFSNIVSCIKNCQKQLFQLTELSLDSYSGFNVNFRTLAR